MADTPPTAASASPNGSWHLMVYSIASAGYLWIEYKNNTSTAAKPETNGIPITSIIFLTGIWLIQYIMVFVLLNQQCNTPNYGLALWSSFAMWFTMFVPMFLCMEYMYTWLQPFANTFGYFVNKMSGLASFMNATLKSKANDPADKIQKYLDYMKEDPWALFSMLTMADHAPDNVKADAKFEELKAGGYLQDGSDTAKQTFVNYVYAKESVAKFVFYILTLNLMTDLTAIIALENSPCAVNLDELSNAPPPKTAATQPTKKPATIYKTSE
jgi:hypothetical protein